MEVLVVTANARNCELACPCSGLIRLFFRTSQVPLLTGPAPAAWLGVQSVFRQLTRGRLVSQRGRTKSEGVFPGAPALSASFA